MLANTQRFVGGPLDSSLGLVETEFSLVRFKGNQDKANQPYKGMEPLKAMDVADTIAYTASRYLIFPLRNPFDPNHH